MRKARTPFVRPGTPALPVASGGPFSLGGGTGGVFQARPFSFLGWGLIDLPLRASRENILIVRPRRARRMVCAFPPIPSKFACLFLHRAAWLILECARRTRPFEGRAFREQEDDQAARLLLPSSLVSPLSVAWFGLPVRTSNEALPRSLYLSLGEGRAALHHFSLRHRRLRFLPAEKSDRLLQNPSLKS